MVLGALYALLIQVFLGEYYLGEILNKLLETNFIKTRPDWLRNKKNKWLELDGFVKNYKLLLNIKVYQHYQLGTFVKTQEQLNIIQGNDIIKLELCQNRGIKLIIIPQIDI